MSVIQFRKVYPNAKKPTRATLSAAGLDLYCVRRYTVPSRGQCLINTGIQIILPDNCYGHIAPRSGLALNHSLHVGAGVIDSDYRGEVQVLLFNLSSRTCLIESGQCIAQLICECIIRPDVIQVDQISDDTERGAEGFGSTDPPNYSIRSCSSDSTSTSDEEEITAHYQKMRKLNSSALDRNKKQVRRFLKKKKIRFFHFFYAFFSVSSDDSTASKCTECNRKKRK